MEAIRTPHRLSTSPEPVGRRVTIFMSILAVHLVVIVLLALSKHSVPPIKKQGTLAVFALAASPKPPAIPEPDPVILIEVPDPINPIKPKEIVPSPEDVHAEQQSAEGDPDGEICSPLGEVTAQLISDPLVPLAIKRVDQSDRSISEAIVMWNAEWSVTAAEDESPLADVRSRVVAILESLPPECLATPVIGPRLIAIPEQGFTTFLAFGSGEWTWQQLVKPVDEVSIAEENSWSWEDLVAEQVDQIHSE